MEIIDTYLDNMFSQYPQTPRSQAVKHELREMMEDTYNGALAAGRSHNEALGQAIAEFGTLDEIDELMQDADPAAPAAKAPSVPALLRPANNLDQYRNYADTLKRTRWLLGFGTAVLVLAPIPLVGLSIASESSNAGFSANAAVAIGFLFLLPLVGVGVGLLVWRAQQLSPFKGLRSRGAAASSEVEAWAANLRQANGGRWAASLIAAISLWVLSALPIIGAAVMTDGLPDGQAAPYLAIGVSATLLLVAVGLLIFLPNTWSTTATSAFSPEAQSAQQSAERYPGWARAILAGFWPLIVAVYLAWSLIGDAWAVSWIIYPIAGVSFAAFAAIIGAIYPE